MMILHSRLGLAKRLNLMMDISPTVQSSTAKCLVVQVDSDGKGQPSPPTESDIDSDVDTSAADNVEMDTSADTGVRQPLKAGTQTLPSLPQAQLSVHQEDDATIGIVLKYIREGTKPTKEQRLAETHEVCLLLKQWDKLLILDSVLVRQVHRNDGG